TDHHQKMKMIEEEISADTQSRDPEKTSRDLFGVQLEVTGLLLEAERRRLVLLQAELAVTSQNRTSFSRKQLEQRQLLDSISRITRQHDQLHREYAAAARGAIFCQLGKGNRSQPAIGLKHSLKNR
ncbi:uncharacterized protein LOC122376503, partial [Amphibalanus amphitrite]|uniref:uncharacterized protein LOC122376503 n=1 Tax=Amphibalanus amphitrite TaxID=1232801 RepID=UPI001C902A29